MTDQTDLAKARQRIAEHVQRRMDRLGLTLTEIHRRTVAMKGGLCGCPACEGEDKTKHPDLPTRGVSTRTLTRFINPEQEPGWRPRPDTTSPTSEALGWPPDAIERLFEHPGYVPPHDAPDWTPSDRARLERLERQVDVLAGRLEDLVESMRTVERLRRALDPDGPEDGG